MMRPVWPRLRRVSGGEASWRAQVAVRTLAQRAAFAWRSPRWDRRDLRRALAGDARSAELDGAIRRGEWLEANRLLLERLARRPARFPVDHASAATLRRAILERWPDAGAEAAERAERILGGRYDLLGYSGLEFTRNGRTEWRLDPVHDRTAPSGFWASVPYLDPACGDHKVIWELNRHQHWLAFGRALWLNGDARFGEAIVAQLSSWLEANPPLDGVNWASMLELGFRSLSWTAALHFLLASDRAPSEMDHAGGPWLVDMLVALDRQLTHVEQNLSYYFSPNTHLTGEALALYAVGLALPELAHSGRWVKTGRRVLIAELERQVAQDGGHAERSTHYHRYTLDFYLLAALSARRGGDLDGEHVFTAAVGRLAPFMQAMADARGIIPVIGDDDAGMLWPIAGRHHRDVRDSLSLAAIVLDRPALAPWGVTEEAYWLAWSTHAREIERGALESGPCAAARVGAHLQVGPRIQTHVFPQTGYAVVRDGDGGGHHLVFDAGAHGYLNGGHAHADALAVTLGVGGRPLLIDPGTATYTMDRALRDRMRSSASHNTLTLDGEGPSIPAGPFHWARRTDAQLSASAGNGALAWVEAHHDGYAGLRHRRSIVHARGTGWVIVDEVLGRDRHRADLHWHFDPAWTLTDADGRCLHAHHPEAGDAWLAHDSGVLDLLHGDTESGLGWCSPSYGTLIPTASARVSRRATAPFSVATWIGAGEQRPLLQRLRTDADPGARATAIRVTRGADQTVTLLRPGEPALRHARSCGVADYQTNARLLQYTLRGPGWHSLALVDATHALALHDGLLSVTADDAIADIHLEGRGDVLMLDASRPPTRLHLQGAAVAPISRLLLNGRELTAPARRRRDALVVTAADWASAEPPAHQQGDEPGTGNPEPGTKICAA